MASISWTHFRTPVALIWYSKVTEHGVVSLDPEKRIMDKALRCEGKKNGKRIAWDLNQYSFYGANG